MQCALARREQFGRGEAVDIAVRPLVGEQLCRDAADHAALGHVPGPARTGAERGFTAPGDAAKPLCARPPETRESGWGGKREAMRVEHGGARVFKKERDKKGLANKK